MYRFVDDELVFIDYNPAANKILKIDHSLLLNKNIRDAFPNISDELVNLYIDCLENGTQIKNVMTEYEDDKIKKTYFRVNGSRTKNKDLAITFEDVSEKVYMKILLDESEDKYKQLVEATGAAIYEVDFINMKFVYVNDVLCERTGYTRDELLNKISPLDLLTEEGHEKFSDRLKRLEKGEYIEDATEYEIKCKDGSSVWIMLTARYKEDENKNVIGANVVAIDITDKMETEKIIKEREAEVVSILEGKIKGWKEEILQKDIERERSLDLINKEIGYMSMRSNSSEVI
jgi:PAS domain S-box-containing protein